MIFLNLHKNFAQISSKYNYTRNIFVDITHKKNNWSLKYMHIRLTISGANRNKQFYTFLENIFEKINLHGKIKLKLEAAGNLWKLIKFQ